jgi:uncharacterized alpha-E superfamily protein
MERAENTARLINAYSYLLLDLPKSTEIGWETIIDILDLQETFAEHHEYLDERSVVRFMLTNRNNPTSIFNCLSMARENARTSREIMPSEAWELINDLYLYARENTARFTSRTGRHTFLPRVIQTSQQLTGLLFGCMSHNHTYDYIVLGRNLERADMTTRIIDVGAGTLYENDNENIIQFESALWINVLRSLSAYQMYRQHVRTRVNARDVVGFLLKNEIFPRAVKHTLNRIAEASRRLPNNRKCLRTITTVGRKVDDANTIMLLKKDKLHGFIDKLQVDIASIHDIITATWFRNTDTVVTQMQSQG